MFVQTINFCNPEGSFLDHKYSPNTLEITTEENPSLNVVGLQLTIILIIVYSDD